MKTNLEILKAYCDQADIKYICMFDTNDTMLAIKYDNIWKNAPDWASVIAYNGHFIYLSTNKKGVSGKIQTVGTDYTTETMKGHNWQAATVVASRDAKEPKTIRDKIKKYINEIKESKKLKEQDAKFKLLDDEFGVMINLNGNQIDTRFVGSNDDVISAYIKDRDLGDLVDHVGYHIKLKV